MQRTIAAVLGSALLTAGGSADAQRAEEFFRSQKQLTMLVGSAPGGGYDGYARMIGRFMSKHLPGNPPFVVSNMPGAGGVRAANFLANVAPKDGSVISIMDRGLPTAALLYGADSKTQFDALKLGWIGNAMRESGMGVVSMSAKATTIEQARSAEITMGAQGPETDPAMFARLLNELIGTKFKTINGYKGQPEVVLAVEKGELDGLFMSGFGGQTTDHLLALSKAGKIGFIVQMSTRPHPSVGPVPLVIDLVKMPEDRQVIDLVLSRMDLGRPFVAPAELPADRLKLLREVFMKALGDPELVAEAQRSKLNIDPMSGEDVEALLRRIYATPKPVIDRVQRIVRIGG